MTDYEGRFEDELGWILMDFKKGKLNYAETTLKIEELIMQGLGFTLYAFDSFAKWNESQSNQPIEPTAEGGGS